MSDIPPARRRVSWLAHGIGNLVVVLLLAIAGWYLLADPRWSPFDLYPLPFNAGVFWALLFVVWAGFNLEFRGFDRLRQPARGVAITAATAAFAIGVTAAFAAGLGRLDPDFAFSREGGLGYFTAALFVLFGFSTWVLAVVNWSHWPWTDLGLKQPLVGFCEIAFLMLPTIVLYLVLGLPAVSAAGSPILEVDPLIGWYYSIIVAIVVTGLTMQNWPWRLVRGRSRAAVTAVAGNVALGTALYFGLLAVCRLLLGSSAVAELGAAVHQFPAQLGVCWVAWMILWANGFGNKPTGFGPAVNLGVRVVVTFVLAVVTFVVYYRFVAGPVLHEPAVAGGLHGNALGFMDWFALVTLLYVVGFGSYGLPKPSGEPAAEPRPAPVPA
ncbi:hypothetical protein [Prauserella muralis]|uniref:Uncharacterized protein n=1 Tax=Prauserella muralis TaxID=588067 RepID=A0A2V4ATG5_9PSEU|nr:hypothetical protein [Prauserella muralis]PXY24637.1 hypothetical protein BAY60_19175 [Prauserella muralis]TWE27674.1 AAT family amino acid transporter [Prauserella muralis]